MHSLARSKAASNQTLHDGSVPRDADATVAPPLEADRGVPAVRLVSTAILSLAPTAESKDEPPLPQRLDIAAKLSRNICLCSSD
jgi:hypothetical protein